MAKKSRFATSPNAVEFKKLWANKQITLSLGACDLSRDFNSPHAVDPEPHWIGYLETTGDVDGLLPVTLYVLPRSPEQSDTVESGCIGFGALSQHSEAGHLHYVATIFDPTRELSEALQSTFLQAAVCNLRWVQISLFKTIMTEEQWFGPWAAHSHSATHAVSSAFLHSRAKLPGAPNELFDWIQTGEIPT